VQSPAAAYSVINIMYFHADLSLPCVSPRMCL
jgi:hypothetical protein